MKRSILLVLQIFTAVIFIQCNNESQKEAETKIDTTSTVTRDTTVSVSTSPNPDLSHNSENSVDWDGMYKGVLPCADCEGIETLLTLNKDKTYTLKTTYLGKSDKVNEEKGNFIWNAEGSNISLTSTANRPNQYKVGENILWQLDMNGNKIGGSNADKYKLTKQTLAAKTIATDTSKSKSDAKLIETYWKLTELNGKSWTTKPGVREIHIILKEKDNKIQGFLGCNTLNGTYDLKDGNRISFSKMATTLMACPDMSMEDALKKVIEKADNYSIKGENLSLNKARMAPLARFQAVNLR